MSSKSLVELELERHDWGSLREIAGSAEAVPDALRGLLAARAPAEIDRFYWRLENRVVAQGGLYQAALPVVSVLLAALVEGIPSTVKGSVLDLLFEIVAGSPTQEEVEAGNAGLGEACRDAAREGLWLIYRELWSAKSGSAVHDTAVEILRQIERDQDRLHLVLQAVAGAD
jgi:hypothetical protein